MNTHVDLFTGIGGFSLAARWLGLQTIAQVELDEYCQEKLQKNFADVPKHRDIADFQPVACDVLTAGFPCQPFSLAGKQLGKDDPRYLWHEVERVIDGSKPKLVVLENVRGLLTNDNGNTFRGILRDLADAGYDAEWYVLPATAVGAIHRRDRLWVIAYAQGDQRQQPRSTNLQARANTTLIGETTSTGLSRRLSEWRGSWSSNGIPDRLAGIRATRPISYATLENYYKNTAMNGDRTKANRNAIKAYGNAIVPQIAYAVMGYGLSKIELP